MPKRNKKRNIRQKRMQRRSQHAQQSNSNPQNYDMMFGYEQSKKMGIDSVHQEIARARSSQSKLFRYHEFKGNERFASNKWFTYSNHDQTIQHNKQTFKMKSDAGSMQHFRHCIGMKKLDFISNKHDRCYYFELRVDRTPTDAVHIGISSSDITNKAPYWRIPVLVAWDMRSGQVSHPQGPLGTSAPPQKGETIGILLDFKTQQWNGCIRIFKNGFDICPSSPIFHGILQRDPYIWEKIPPVSLYIGAYYQAKFQFTIKQFPTIPAAHALLFDTFYTETLKIENTIKLISECSPSDSNTVMVEILRFVLKTIPELKSNNMVDDRFRTQIINKSIAQIYERVFHEVSDRDLLYDCWAPLFLHGSKNLVCTRIFTYICTMFEFEEQSGWIQLFAAIMGSYMHPGDSIDCDIGLYELLEHLAGGCSGREEYQMSRRIFNKLGKKYVHEQSVISQIKTVDEMWNNMRCINCGANGKLRTCKGCMKRAYCSKYCQKYHWKYDHRYNCDRTW
eukprot:390282_1